MMEDILFLAACIPVLLAISCTGCTSRSDEHGIAEEHLLARSRNPRLLEATR